MGTLVGGLVILVNGKNIIDALGGLPSGLGWVLLAVAVAVPARVAWTAWQKEKARPEPDPVPA